MKHLQTLSAIAVLALPLLAGAAPSVTITYPKPNANLTNGLVTVTGTATGSAAITNVSYSLNGEPWGPAVGTNSWYATNLVLTPGANIFQVYAVDKKGATSKVDKISFTY